MKPYTLIGLTLCTLALCLVPVVADAATLADRVAALERAVAALQSQNAAQQATINALQSQVDSLNGNNALALSPYLTVDTTTHRILFTGVNLQVVNGIGETSTRNGLGNVIIGYDSPGVSVAHCSDGQYEDQVSCEAAGEIWGRNHNMGSHYLVTGSANSYSQYGGLVAGSLNISNAPYASVIGGYVNQASGWFATVTGGGANRASGWGATVTGGYVNRALGTYTSVSGGHDNDASGDYASVNGGSRNNASGESAIVTGGSNNTASGTTASVSGGASRTASGTNDWRAGALYQNY